MNYDDYKFGYKHNENWGQTGVDPQVLKDQIKKFEEMMAGTDRKQDKIIELTKKYIGDVEEFLKEKYPEEFI